ncbi:KamA family radical SAM protein [Acidaminobacter sp. JC074]|uniref:KamA family radical SAM protein n=1 Tax=Acidaminobacter sp. JC074 TaxID=2530199 RepID=UPI001F103C2F|nr:KamA family radical SAM protein [Acidaminobacter sp. JC074]MCH4887170.1 KamA family radical SAM protein [Acidaminobacter sp. JC074]
MEKWELNLRNDIVDLRVKDQETTLEEVIERHPMRIPKYYYDLIDQNDPNDPIKRISYPNAFEVDLMGDYDTSGEASNTKLPGLQHKYSTTALVLTTSTCFMYCRHCFRKRLVGLSSEEINSRLDETIKYLSGHEEINNVLLSGGDSFCLTDEQIEAYLKGLTEIKHLNYIRFGTRSLVVYPERITDNLVSILEKYSKKKEIVIVTQFNHPRELTQEALNAIKKIKNIGVSINNQAVVLKGVNDTPDVLAELLNGLNRVGINPYYVFQCRPVKAVKIGFQKTLLETYTLIQETRKKLDGLSKRFRLIMSHPRGKVEIVGVHGNQMIFRFHQAKDMSDHDKMFIREIDEKAQWLDNDLMPIE